MQKNSIDLKQAGAVWIIAVTLVIAGWGSANGGPKSDPTAAKGLDGPRELTASDASPGDRFGTAISLSGTRSLVGAPGSAGGSGAAYLFELNEAGWTQIAKLVAPAGVAADGFGRAVALDGARAAIGAPGRDDAASNAGAIYVFDFDGSTWNFTDVVTGPDLAAEDGFGEAVDVRADRIVAGAPRHNSSNGAAYVFDLVNSQWTFSTKLTPSAGTINQAGPTKGSTTPSFFGASVSLGLDRVVAGAPEEDNAQGAAYVFDLSGGSWTETQRLAPGFLEEEDRFGTAVSLFNDRTLVGVPGSNRRSGAAEIFDFDGASWVIAFTQLAVDDTTEVPVFGECTDQLGSSVSLWGDYALVGAATDDVWGDFAGSAYLFQFYNNDWFRIVKFTEDGGAADRLFGQAVAFEAGLAVAGAPGEDFGLRNCSPGISGPGSAQSTRVFDDPSLGLLPDQFEVDDTREQASDIQVGMQFDVDEYPQRHNLHTATDLDYVQFLYNAASSYTIRVQPRDTTLSLGLVLEDASGNELDSAGCSNFDSPGTELNVFPPGGLQENQILFPRVFECQPGSASGTRDYDVWVAGVGHQQCVLLEGNVNTAISGDSAPFLWLFSDINNTVITDSSGFYRLCADYDIRELTTFDPRGITQPAVIDVLAGVACSPNCIEPDYEDDDGFIRPRIRPGSRARLDFEVPGPVIFRSGFEAVSP
ncbi:MAG: hypothetical protein AAF358_04035 [Pseudomonadota bacterium]